jgi:hypothetical protein
MQCISIGAVVVVGCTTIYAISAYYHERCEFESRSGQMYMYLRQNYDNYVIKFVSDLQQIHGFLWVLQFPPQYN